MLHLKDKTGQILHACMEVHRTLGPGFLESVYQEALETEFKLEGIPYEREKHLNVFYKNIDLGKNYYADFYCFDGIIVELKATTSLLKEHMSQVINYLKAANEEVGLLVNFGATSLKWERISIFGLTK